MSILTGGGPLVPELAHMVHCTPLGTFRYIRSEKVHQGFLTCTNGHI